MKDGVLMIIHNLCKGLLQKQNNEQGKNFNHFFNEWMALHKDDHSDNYRKEILKRANKHLLPYIGKTPIAETKPTQIIEVLR